jgi:dethiobiotin synthetase
VSGRGYFIAGTDTDVGKTRVTTGLIAGFREQGLRVSGMKPVAAGVVSTENGFFNDDVIKIADISGQNAGDINLNPYSLPEPLSPNIAAEHAGISIDLEVIRRHYLSLAQESDVVVVEGAGGWLVPISDRLTMADVAATLGLPVILTVGLRLGCLNHSLLTAQAIRQQGLKIAGWVGNHIDPSFAAGEENIRCLATRLASPPLALLPWDRDARSAWPALRQAAARLTSER